MGDVVTVVGRYSQKYYQKLLVYKKKFDYLQKD